METYNITLIKRRVISQDTEYDSAFFKDDLSQNYGEHHFITTAGEVAIIDLLNDGEKWNVIREINDIIKIAWDNVNPNPGSKMLSSIQKDAWRYFADRSPKGKTWFLENIFDPYLYEQVDTGKKIVEIVQQVDLKVAPVEITYNGWNSLTNREKLIQAENFVLHPVKGNKPIPNEPQV